MIPRPGRHDTRALRSACDGRTHRSRRSGGSLLAGRAVGPAGRPAFRGASLCRLGQVPRRLLSMSVERGVPMITNYVVRHPVVVQQAAARYSDFQLRIADRITAFAGSMLFVYLHIALFADACRLARGDLPLDVRDDRSEPAGGVPRGQGRPRLRGAGAGARVQHRADRGDPRAHARNEPDAGGLHGGTAEECGRGAARPGPAAGGQSNQGG